MRNAGQDEAQVGIKIAGRIINYLRYGDDTTRKWRTKKPLVESERGEGKSWFKTHVNQKANIMASHPISLWQIEGETKETVSGFIFLGSRITADGDCSHDIKRHLLIGRTAMTNPDSILKSRDITLPTKEHLIKATVFPVVTYGCESWSIKKP